MTEKIETQKKSRINNFLKNSAVGIIMQFFSIILAFVNRTIFIKLLSNNYLSVNGLFSNILNTLSAIELGFGMALIYMMYKPVAENDKEKIKTIVAYYKKVYYTIGTLLFVLGLLVIPFMGLIIKDPPQIKENLNFIYVLFLVSTCIGYFCSHKIALINANQENYIVYFYTQLTKWIQTILQIIVLLATKNYVLYLFIQILCALLYNLMITIKCNKLYPYIKEKKYKEMSKKEKKQVTDKVKSLIFYRLNPAILNGSDNIIISSVVGLSYVGIYSNYYLLTNYLSQFIDQIIKSLESGIGNLNAIETPTKKEEIFYKVFYMCFFIYGFVCLAFFLLVNDFINIWLGKEYLLNMFVVFTIVLYFYINGVHTACYTYRTTSGLFEKNKLAPLYEVIINIASSIILGKFLGIAGVFLGTSIARLTTFFWIDPKLLYKYLFVNGKKMKYYKRYAHYIISCVLIALIMWPLSKLWIATNYLQWILKAIVLSIIVIILLILFTCRIEEFKEMFNIVKTKIEGIIIKITKKDVQI